MRTRRNGTYFVLLVVLLVTIWISYRSVGTSSSSQRPLSDFLSAIQAASVSNAGFKSSGVEVVWKDETGVQYRTYYPNGHPLLDKVAAASIPYTVDPPSPDSNSSLTILLPNILMFLVIAGFWFYLLRTKSSLARPAA